MKTIILCGGKGHRLREKTVNKPKVMVKIGDKPILWHIMKICSHYGYKDFILTLGYRGDCIKKYFFQEKSFKITFSEAGLNAGISERVSACSKYLTKKDKDFILIYGDNLADINLGKMVAFHKKRSVLGTIAGVHSRSKYGFMVVDQNSMIKKFEEKPVLPKWINGGFLVLNKKALEYFGPKKVGHQFLLDLIKDNQLGFYPHQGFWQCMDNYKEYKHLNKLWSLPNPPWKVWK